MVRRPPICTLTDPLVPSTTLCRSHSVGPAPTRRLAGLFLQDQVAIDADAVDAEQGDILPPDAFAVGLQETPADQREAARHEDEGRPAGPAPPEIERNEQRREPRGPGARIGRTHV